MNKVELIQSYIDKCTALYTSNTNQKEAGDLIDDIVAVFEKEIPTITTRLRVFYNVSTLENGLKDINTLILILENYKSDLEENQLKEEKELEKLRLQAEISRNSVTVNNTNNNQNHSEAISSSTANVTITIEQVLDKIKNLPTEILSDTDKSDLEDKLNAIEIAKKSKDKKKLMDKIGSVLKYITDKSVVVAVAALPYLAEISKFIDTI